MEWAKVSVSLMRDPRVQKAGKDALLYHLAAILYCKEVETDGVVPARASRALAAEWIDDPTAAREACVEHGLLRFADNGDVIVKGWLDWNPSRRDIEAKREADRERQRRHRDETPAQEPSRRDTSRDARRDTKRESRRLSSREEVEVEIEVELEGDKPLAPDKPARARDPIWDGLEMVFGYRPTTDAERGRWNKACKMLREIDQDERWPEPVTTDSVVAAAERFRESHPDVSVTALAIATNYQRLMSAPTNGTMPARRRKVTGGDLIRQAMEEAKQQ